MAINKLFILVGPSGVGKDAVLEGVIKKIKGLKRFPSFTTRLPRKGEKNGREYFFVAEKEFRQLMKKGELLEHEEVHPGLFYGTPAVGKLKNLLKKHNLIKPIDILGSQSIKKVLPETTVIIFIKPPNARELKARIKKRGGLTAKEMEERLGRFDFEIKNAHLANYQVINDKLEKCVSDIVKIIKKELKKEG
jgi:guanylate kinase